jgi:WD40 repeat protein
MKYKLFAHLSKNGIHFYSVDDYKLIKIFTVDNEKLTSFEFSEDGLDLLIGTKRGNLIIYDLKEIIPEFFGLDLISILINHLLELYYYAGVKDMIHLDEILNNLNKLPENMQDAVKKIIENIIKRVGKESKTIEISENGKPESKDIEVK